MTTTDSVPVDNRPTVDCGPFTFFRPTKGRVAITLLLVGVCVALGVWQIQRLAWKEGLIAELAVAQDSRHVLKGNLPEDLGTLLDKNFYPIMLPGEYVHEHEVNVIGRSINGEPGFNVYTPFRIADDGRMVLVNRGWIPQSKKDLADRPEDPQFDGMVFASGFISVPQGGSVFLPDHDVAGNVWFWPDIARINAEKKLEMPLFTIEIVNANPPKDVLPLPRKDNQIELRNDHFNYALMWFSLAFSGLVIFFIYHLKSVKGDDNHEPTPKT